MSDVETTTHDWGHLWAVHSEKEGQPRIRGWAKSEADADALAARIQGEDGEAREDSYWVVRLTKKHIAMFKATGFIPSDA